MQFSNGKTALITGASSGIGETFSNELAQQGVNLVLVARSESKLREIARKLKDQFNVRVEVIVQDLASSDATAEIVKAVEQLGFSIDILINNAGFANQGHFESIESERDANQIAVDISAVVSLTHAFVPTMIAKKAGTIINVASLAAFQPIPYMAVYAASKAFVLSFSLALAEELSIHGVEVMTLCPGATETGFFQVAGEVAGAGRRRTSYQVVQTALKGLSQKKRFVIDGAMNSIAAGSTRLLSPQLNARLMGAVMRASENRKR